MSQQGDRIEGQLSDLQKQVSLLLGQNKAANNENDLHCSISKPAQAGLGFAALCNLVGPLVIHALNPCVRYTGPLYWSSIGIYTAVSVILLFTSWIYNTRVLFCDEKQLANHKLLEPILYAAIGATLGWYDYYTYTIVNYGPLAGAMAMYLASIGLYLTCFMEVHLRRCPLYREDHLEVVSGTLYGPKCKLGWDIFSLILWLALVGIIVAFDNELNGPTRPAGCVAVT